MSDSHDTTLQTAIRSLVGDFQGDGPPALSLTQIRLLAKEHGCTTGDVERAALGLQVLPERYRRNLGTVGWDGQLRLLESRVGVVGAGGLGGWILELLARMGVGQIVLVDGDTFQENNLNRQLGCTEVTLGLFKAEVVAERLHQVNGACEVTAHVAWLTKDNARELLHGCQVLVDALDTLPARLLLEETAQDMGVPLVHGAIGGYSGQVMTVYPGDPGLHGLFGGAAPERGVETRLGNPAATPMMIAAWQVQEVVKLLTGRGKTLRGRLLLMDAEIGEVSEVDLG